MFLVGFEREVEAFSYRYKPWTCGMNVVAAVALRDGDDTLDDDLTLAAASARMLRPDDVFILAPWSRTDVIDACVTAFLRVPARIHLGPGARARPLRRRAYRQGRRDLEPQPVAAIR